MKKKLSGDEVKRRIAELAFGKCNDAVKLIFLEPEQYELLDGLDLRMVSEVKRGSNGSVEVKLINRTDLLKLLAGQTETTENVKGNDAASFFVAMDKAAKRLGDEKA